MAIPAPAPDRTCIVTGSSSGIGVEIARLLAARGHGVTLVARREDRLRALADELTDRHGIRSEVIAADLTDADARRGVIARVDDLGLSVEVLVNNAGFGTAGALASIDPEREISMLRTNVEALDHLCALVVPEMVARGRGGILNVASTASYQPLPGQAGYAASKAFVRSFSLALAGEVAARGVTVTVLCPGPVETEFADVSGLDGVFDEGGAVPPAMLVPAAEVARVGIDGLDAGRLTVIPGAANRVTALLGAVTPPRLLLPLVARFHPALRH